MTRHSISVVPARMVSRGVVGLVAAGIVTIGLTSMLAKAGGASASANGGQAGRPPQAPPLIMTSTAWADGGILPDKYTQAVVTPVSPELKWTQVPPGTQSFVLSVRDPEPTPDKSSKTVVTHWLIWNIPGTSTGLPENVPHGDLLDGSRQVARRGQGYVGPGAPPGPYHHYTFELYALDTKIDVPPGKGTPEEEVMTRAAVFDAMDGHVLGKAVLVARFHR